MSLYRGAGGASDATDDSTVNAVAGYASAAASSASAAATSATEASNSATAAASSASSAATSASSVATNATNASNSAALAANSAALSLTYRNSAFTNRNLAQTAAGNASVSEANAATSAASAATSATNAENSRIESSNILTDNMAVRDATLAIYGNTTAMNNAVTAAATSATTATTQATNAASSAALASAYSYAANAAVSGASSYADSAQNSANDAQAYATSALSARDATLAAYDSFDDRYLGVKSADPTVDNDGNPLIAGSLYFNNQTNMMMLRAGNAWVAAYTSGGSPSFGNTVVNGTLGVTGAVTLSGGTANGVAYLNGSKVLTTGSALTFDGTNFAAAGVVKGSGGARFEGAGSLSGTGVGAEIFASGGITYYGSYDRTGAAYAPTIYVAGTYQAWNVSGEQMRLTSTGLGIGTSSPGTKLDVVGTTAVEARVYASDNSTGKAKIYLRGGASNFSFETDASNGSNYLFENASGQLAYRYFAGASGYWQWYTAGSERMRLDASGNLSVGSTSNNGRISAYITTDGGVGLFSRLTGGTNQPYLQVKHTEAGGVTTIDGNSGTGTYALAFSTGSTERMRLDSSGNVGIGTSSPTTRLQLAKANTTTGLGNGGLLTLENTDGGAFDQRAEILFKNVSQVTSAISSSYTGFAAGPQYAGALIFATKGTADSAIVERMRLDSSGNLGLGVTPSAWNSGKAFQLSSTTSIFNDGTDTYFGNNFYYSSGWKYLTTAAAMQYQQGAGGHKWFNAPSGTAGNAISFTQAMTLDASGNLGIGSTSPLARLNVVGSPDATFNSQIIIGAGGATAQKLTFNPTLSSAIAGLSDGSLAFYGNGANTERARIDSSGNLLVGQTSNGFANNNGIFVNPTASGGLIGINHASGSASGQQYCAFGYNGSQIGSITQSGTTAVLYNVTSDQRLKENIQDADSASALIDSLQVRKYDWKADGSHQRYGFIAQELMTVVPEAVHQPADPEEMMAVDYSKLVPMLVKEVQSLRARVAQLESN